jgi:hypothetical protein
MDLKIIHVETWKLALSWKSFKLYFLLIPHYSMHHCNFTFAPHIAHQINILDAVVRESKKVRMVGNVNGTRHHFANKLKLAAGLH